MNIPKSREPLAQKRGGVFALGRSWAGSKVIAAGDRIPFFQKLMFSAGGMMDFFSTGLVIWVLWMPYFNIGLGIGPALLGMVMMLFQIWNAILDPVMGNLSDNTRTRWGRRRPFMLVGAVLTAAVFPWLWHPPIALGEKAVAIYLIGIGLLFFTAYSCWAMPYYGLQLELTPNYDERTRLSAWGTLFQKLTGLLSGWIMAILASSLFANAVTGKPDIVRGMHTCSLIFAGCILVTGLLPAFFVRERYYEAEACRQAREPFWQSIRESFQCRSLRMLIGLSFLLMLGTVVVSNLGNYLGIYWVMRGDLAGASIVGGWQNTVMVVTGIVCIPFWTWLGERFDKKTVVAFMLGVTMIGHLLNLWCMCQDHPWYRLLPAVTESAAIAAAWLFVPSMKADVADQDELATGRRREGSLNSFFSIAFKASLACGSGLGGLVFNFSGFDINLLANQPPGVFLCMRILYIVLPLVIWGGALFFIFRYPLNRQRMAEIRAELEQRRGKL